MGYTALALHLSPIVWEQSVGVEGPLGASLNGTPMAHAQSNEYKTKHKDKRETCPFLSPKSRCLFVRPFSVRVCPSATTVFGKINVFCSPNKYRNQAKMKNTECSIYQSVEVLKTKKHQQTQETGRMSLVLVQFWLSFPTLNSV